MRKFDKIIIGAGLYGCYAANLCGKRNETVLVLEYDEAPFQRATYINQAGYAMGYHYPKPFDHDEIRRIFPEICRGFFLCIHIKFDQIYATSENFFMDECGGICRIL